jgi:hypothetical protein
MNLKNMTRDELYEIAKKFDIKNRSKMTKDELVKSIKKYNKAVAPDKTPQTQEEKITSHMTQTPAPKAEIPKKPEYPIPDKYNLDTVVLLPVNPKKEYVYWEVSDKTVDQMCRQHSISQPVFILKVFQTDGTHVDELASIRTAKYGNWYFDLYCPDMSLWAELGMLDNMGNYYPIIASKTIKMPSDKVSSIIDQETWMTVGEKIEKIFDLSGLGDVQKDELLSSARMHSELFKKLHASESLSSASLHKKQGGE